MAKSRTEDKKSPLKIASNGRNRIEVASINTQNDPNKARSRLGAPNSGSIDHKKYRIRRKAETETKTIWKSGRIGSLNTLAINGIETITIKICDQVTAAR